MSEPQISIEDYRRQLRAAIQQCKALREQAHKKGDVPTFQSYDRQLVALEKEYRNAKKRRAEAQKN